MLDAKFSSSVVEWDADKVSKWISHQGFATYSAYFADHNVSGDVLLLLDQLELREIGVIPVGHRLRILKAIYELAAAQEPPLPADVTPRYVPATVKTARGDPVAYSLALRDDRMGYAETELKKLIDSHYRLRADLLPIFRAAKESKPLPTPDNLANPANSSAAGTTGTTGVGATLLSGHQTTISPTLSSPAMASPTHAPTGGPGIKRVLSKKSMGNLTTNPASRSPTTAEWDDSHQNRSRRGLSTTASISTLPNLSSTATATAAATSSSTTGATSPSSEPFKSFRVTMEDPCYKVLPAALRKYKIAGDWRQYALLVCYGDQERQLGMDEKPLMIFKELQDAGKRPVFMLRHMESSTPGGTNPTQGVVVGSTPGGVL